MNIGEDAQARILVVEDDTVMRQCVVSILRGKCYQVDVAADAYRALSRVETFEPDLIISDLCMPGIDGLALLHQLRDKGSDALGILITGFGSVGHAVHAMRQGLFDYLTKPFAAKQLLETVEAALRQHRLRSASSRTGPPHALIGPIQASSSSPKMAALFRDLAKVAPTSATVLLTGETGVGKEVVARAIHASGFSPSGPFVSVHCASLCESLLESELFGHESGAFTGALRRRHGKFAQADGGTLFLDEIGEISPLVQTKLLRIIQEKQFERVGGNETVSVNVRLVAATHRDLRHEVEQGRFRRDLFYRLNVISLCVPPLRLRREDIPQLVAVFLQQFNQRHAKQVTHVDDDVMQILYSHAWPGNVRELENALEHAVIMTPQQTIRRADLPKSLIEANQTLEGSIIVPGSKLKEIERFAVTKTLEHVRGSTIDAARMLGISRRKVQYVVNASIHAGRTPGPDAGVLQIDAKKA